MKKLFVFSLLAVLLLACSKENIECQCQCHNQNQEQNQDQGQDQGQNQDQGQGQNQDDGGLCLDWSPLIMGVYVNDAEGNTLLDTTSDRCIDLSKIVVTYNGEQYTLPERYLSAQRLYYLAVFQGVYLSHDGKGVPYLRIGEWARDEKWNNCEVEIAWGDGTKDILSFSHNYEWDPAYKNDPEHDYGYSFTTEWYLNGKPNENAAFYIVK